MIAENAPKHLLAVRARSNTISTLKTMDDYSSRIVIGTCYIDYRETGTPMVQFC